MSPAGTWSDSGQDARNLEAFRRIVLASPALQERLRALTEHSRFIAETMKLGREHGCVFSPEQVEAALVAERRGWLERWFR